MPSHPHGQPLNPGEESDLQSSGCKIDKPNVATTPECSGTSNML